MGLDALLENQLGHLPKFQKFHIFSISTSGVKIELIFTLHVWAAVFEIHADFQNCHIWAGNLVIGQSARSRTYALFPPHGIKIELIFTLRAVVSEIRADFQNCHTWAWNFASGQSSGQFTPVLALYDPFGVDVPLNFDITHSLTHRCWKLPY